MANSIIASNAFDGNLKKSTDQKASDSTKSRVRNQPVANFDDGEYIVLAQKHFNVDSTRTDGSTVASSRLVVVNLAGGYARSYKISDMNGTVATVEKIDQEATTLARETVKDRRDNKTEVIRLKRGQLPRPVRALAQGYLPLAEQGDDIVVSIPFKMKINGNLTGYNVSYVEQLDGKGKGTGHYDVEIDPETDEVVFTQVSFPSFSTDQKVSTQEINKAKAIIEADAQMKSLTDGRLLG